MPTIAENQREHTHGAGDLAGEMRRKQFHLDALGEPLTLRDDRRIQLFSPPR